MRICTIRSTPSSSSSKDGITPIVVTGASNPSPSLPTETGQLQLVAAEDLSNVSVVWTAVGDDEPDFAMTIAICGTVGGAGGAEALDAMLAALADRGPERATWTEGGSGLGRRGAPSPEPGPSGRPAQPFPVDHGAGLVVAADARLDDRDALCDALGVPLPERAGLADAELILRAFMRWGRDCPHHLLGDYAFAVRDRRRRTLFCARDHIGARPFYYALTTRRFVFASAVEAVLAAPDVSDALDERVVATHLTVQTLRSGARTFFAAVRKLPPGHTLTIEAGRPEDGSGGPRVRIEQYWHPEQAPAARPASDDAYAEQLLDLYTQAVRDRLRAGPVGVHLSGGLDSSSVAVLAAREVRRRGHPPPPAFTWLPEPGARPPKPEHAREYALVDAVCAQEGLQTCYGAPTPDDVLDVLRLDGTLPGVQVHLNEEIVQRHASARGVRVLLSGWGGDQCVSFNGRGYRQHLLLSGRWRRLAAEYRDQDAWAPRFLAGIVLPLLHPALPSTLHRLRTGKGMYRRWLIDPAFARRAKPLATPWGRAVGVRPTQLQHLQAGHLSARIEGWAASGARRGIEYRYPLLDRRLLEFALGLPPEQFRRGRWGRWLFRHGLRAVLPPEVCWSRGPDDAARYEAAMDAFTEAFPMIRRLLAACTPARARYVDMPRLWERLDAARFRAMPQPKPIMNALRLLDF